MWVPLHVHTIYSSLDGAVAPKEYAAWAAERGVPAAAVTDHYTVSGFVPFEKAFSSSVKPIFGCELGCECVTEEARKLGRSYAHLNAWALDERGLRNLMRLSSAAYGNIKRKPLVHAELLRAHSDGLAFGSACQSGELQVLLDAGCTEGALSFLSFMRSLPAPFYGEVMRVHTGPEESEAETKRNLLVRDFCTANKVPYLVTSDSHYTARMRPFHGTMLEIKRLSGRSGRRGSGSGGGEKRHDMERDETSFRSLGWMSETDLELPQNLGTFEASWRAAGFGDGIDETVRFAERVPRLSCSNAAERAAGGGWLFPKNRTAGRLSFRDRARLGFERLVDDGSIDACDKNRYERQLVMEMQVVESMGFPDYFMLVSDITDFARSSGIFMGAGRGSAAGSMLAWALGITNVDPIRYGLVFERFLNPERVSMPDIDLDFEDERRPEIIRHLRETYGSKGERCVTGIANATTVKWKSALRDSLRAHLPDDETAQVNRIASAFEPLTERYEAERTPPETAVAEMIAALRSRGGLVRKSLLSVAERAVEQAAGILGQVRNVSRHASGIVVSPGEITDYAPIWRLARDGDEWMTQYDMSAVEHVGLIKIDCLGLSTLRQIRRTCELASESGESGMIPPTMNDFYRWSNRQGSKDGERPSVDEGERRVADHAHLAWELLASGDSTGVFQVESGSMRSLLGDIEPKSIDDLGALLALYRPGPITSGLMDAFASARLRMRAERLMEEVRSGTADRSSAAKARSLANRAEKRARNGKIGTFPNSMKDIVRRDVAGDADGFPIYQEHILKMSRVFAGFSLGGADLLRRAMGKKKPDEMAREYGKFLRGATRLGYSAADADEAFGVIEHFAAYGFNKAHSTAYAYLSFCMAWLKAVYPVSFNAAFLEVNCDDKDKRPGYIRECLTTTGVALPDLAGPLRGRSGLAFAPCADEGRYYESVPVPAFQPVEDMEGAGTKPVQKGRPVDLASLSKRSFDEMLHAPKEPKGLKKRETPAKRVEVSDLGRRRRDIVGHPGVPVLAVSVAAKYTGPVDEGYDEAWSCVSKPSDLLPWFSAMPSGLYSPVLLLGRGMAESALSRLLLWAGCEGLEARLAMRAWFLAAAPGNEPFAASVAVLESAFSKAGLKPIPENKGRKWLTTWGLKVSETSLRRPNLGPGLRNAFDAACRLGIAEGLQNEHFSVSCIAAEETELYGTSLTIPEWNAAIVEAHLSRYGSGKTVPSAAGMSRSGRDLFDPDWNGYGTRIEDRTIEGVEYRMIDNVKGMETATEPSPESERVVLCGVLRHVDSVEDARGAKYDILSLGPFGRTRPSLRVALRKTDPFDDRPMVLGKPFFVEPEGTIWVPNPRSPERTMKAIKAH